MNITHNSSCGLNIQDGASNGHISTLQYATEVGKLSQCVGRVPQLKPSSDQENTTMCIRTSRLLKSIHPAARRYQNV